MGQFTKSSLCLVVFVLFIAVMLFSSICNTQSYGWGGKNESLYQYQDQDQDQFEPERVMEEEIVYSTESPVQQSAQSPAGGIITEYKIGGRGRARSTHGAGRALLQDLVPQSFDERTIDIPPNPEAAAVIMEGRDISEGSQSSQGGGLIDPYTITPIFNDNSYMNITPDDQEIGLQMRMLYADYPMDQSTNWKQTYGTVRGDDEWLDKFSSESDNPHRVMEPRRSIRGGAPQGGPGSVDQELTPPGTYNPELKTTRTNLPYHLHTPPLVNKYLKTNNKLMPHFVQMSNNPLSFDNDNRAYLKYPETVPFGFQVP